jgi:hypothetical protein
LEVEDPGEAALPARAAHAVLPVWAVVECEEAAVECEAVVAADEAAGGEDKRTEQT